MRKFTQYLKCEFSATEIADKAKELATANRGKLEAESAIDSEEPR